MPTARCRHFFRAASLATLDGLNLALKHGPSGWDSPASPQEGRPAAPPEHHLGAEGHACSVAVLLHGVRLLLEGCSQPDAAPMLDVAALQLLYQHRTKTLTQGLCEGVKADLASSGAALEQLFTRLCTRLALPRTPELEATLLPLLQAKALHATAITTALREAVASSLLHAKCHHPSGRSTLTMAFVRTELLQATLQVSWQACTWRCCPACSTLSLLPGAKQSVPQAAAAAQSLHSLHTAGRGWLAAGLWAGAAHRWQGLC